MCNRLCLMVAALTLSMVMSAAQAEVFVYSNEEGTPWDLTDTIVFSNMNDLTEPAVQLWDDEGETLWIDYPYAGSATVPNSQYASQVIKPDLSQIPAGPVGNVEYALGIYRNEFAQDKVALARITEDNNLAELSHRYRTTSTGVADPEGGSPVEWSQWADGVFPFISVERDGDGNIVNYGEGEYDLEMSTLEVVSGQRLTDFVDDVVNNGADYYGFVAYETAGGNVGWCGSGNKSGFCGSPQDQIQLGAYNHKFSVTIIPEPASVALVCVGSTLLLIRRRRA